MSKLDELLEKSPTLAILDSFAVANLKINDPCNKNISASISGGADSDVVLDILTKLDVDKKIKYVFFDTGLEYQATKDHLQYLENKYGVEIIREKAIKPIPLSCRQYGQPFMSKQVSEFIQRLQKYDFLWEDKPFNQLLEEYPKCKAALRWWCNNWGEKSKFNISNNKWLKEFMIANPPDFYISNKCCHYAKKVVVKNFVKNNKMNLNVYGVRKAEGGARSTAYKNCFTNNNGEADEYRPIFYYNDGDRETYEKTFNVTHSKCYTEYGLKRTGCAGCPYGKDFELELEVIEKYEPKLYRAVNKIFKDSYEYTRKYREFVAQMNAKERGEST